MIQKFHLFAQFRLEFSYYVLSLHLSIICVHCTLISNWMFSSSQWYKFFVSLFIFDFSPLSLPHLSWWYTNIVTDLLLAFSLPRNWYKLTTESQNSELSRDLRAINCFRTICMFGVICAHCALANNMVPMLNPYFIEEVCAFEPTQNDISFSHSVLKFSTFFLT